MVSNFLPSWRKQSQTDRPKLLERLATKQATMLLCKGADDRSAVEQQLFERLIEKIPTYAFVLALAIEFREALQRRDPAAIRRWIHNTTRCGIAPLVRFAWGLHRDLRAVVVAAETERSSGQVEGHINRLKTIKRQMYGRAGFALLRARVLPFSAHSPPWLHRTCGRAHSQVALTTIRRPYVGLTGAALSNIIGTLHDYRIGHGDSDQGRCTARNRAS